MSCRCVAKRQSTGRKEPLLRTVQRVVIDQLSYGPLNNAAAMAYIACVINRLPLVDVPRLLRRKFVGVQLKGWRVWPAAMFINYRFVPQVSMRFAARVGVVIGKSFVKRRG